MRFALRMKKGFKTTVGLLVTLPFLYWNCSGSIGSPATSPAAAGTALPTGLVTLTPGQTGVVQALQDRIFIASLSGSDPGPFQISGLPSWATFNSTTGAVTGTATLMADTGTFVIKGTQTTYGPITVQVVGNVLKEYQWHLNNTGQTAFAGAAGVAGQDLHITQTIQSGITGTGITMAFSDTGAFVLHEALAPNLLAGQSRNYLNNFSATGSWLGDPTPDLNTPDNAHGTATAALAVEKGWIGVGGRGMAPDASFASFLFIQAQDQLSNEGLSTVGLNDQFEGSFDIFNYSWTDPQCTFTEYPSSYVATVQATTASGRGGLGPSMLVAGGNNYVEDISDCFSTSSTAVVFGNANMSELQTNPYIVPIAAVNANGVSSSYSTPGSNLWVAAPGGEFGLTSSTTGQSTDLMPALITADFPGCSIGMKTFDSSQSGFDAGQSPNTACNYQSTMNGTSGATPLAAGAVALMMQVNPALTWRDVKYILAKTADVIDSTVNPASHPDTNLNLTGHVYDLPWITNAAGFHFMDYYGFGRINVDNAVAMARSYTSALGTFTQTNWVNDSGTINATIPDASAAGLTETMSTATNLTLEAVQIRATISNCIGDMGLELTSPSGTKSILLNINNESQDGALSDHTFLSNAFYGEKSAGTWTFKVIDGHAGCIGSLTNWKINFSGH